MPINIELKAVLKCKETAIEVANKLDKMGHMSSLNQVDTFYHGDKCRLKLRRENGAATLIAYARDDRPDSRRSDYEKVAVANPEELAKVLEKALGVVGEVIKQRLYCLVRYKGVVCRIHIDDVIGLGDFIEFEVQVDEAEVPLGHEFIEYLKGEFSINDEDLISGAYLDEIKKKKSVTNGN